MRFNKIITTVDGHTEGEPVRFVVGGIPHIPGKGMAEKRDFFKQNLDYLRTALCFEPRGHRTMFSCVMTPPVTDEAAFGVIFMGSTTYPDMCGHGSMGVAVMAVEMGIVEKKEPVTEIAIDTPSGTIHARVNIEQGTATSVTLRNVPSFLFDSILINVARLGQLHVDIAYGGIFFAIVRAKDIRINPRADDIAAASERLRHLKESIEKQVEIKHPELDFISGITGFVINDEPSNPKANIKNIACPSHGRYVDRSPCGTGTCAKMAALYAKGELGLGETYVTESIIGSLFWGKLIEEVKVGSFRAVLPEVTGRAFVTGIHNFVIDEGDPFKYGFQV